jgi:hypothetical protein
MRYPRIEIMRVPDGQSAYYVAVEVDHKTRSLRRLSLVMSALFAFGLGLCTPAILDALGRLL